MGVTVCANGLSVVHKGSGGEANATLPDVCLTTVGNAVVPIPYGNNAKSADLADGTTTVSMDGGNSIAIKGSKFAASTGDAGGDKKGVASGTIEAEAEFISASPTVSMEGKGVCRLSDQMTMNKANTMCLGGAQNPSVTVTEDAEGTYTVELALRYADGDPVQDASYTVIDSQNTKFEGHLDSEGKAIVNGLAPGEFSVEYGEDAREFVPNEPTLENPNFNASASAEDIINGAQKGKPGFWESTKSATLGAFEWVWGVIQGDFNEDQTIAQIIANAGVTMIPFIDQVADVRDIVANIMKLSSEEGREKSENWVDLVLTIIGCIPTLGSLLKGVGKIIIEVGKDIKLDDLLAILRQLGKGNPAKFLRELKFTQYTQDCVKILSDILTPSIEAFEEMAGYANRLGYATLGHTLKSVGAELKIIDDVAPDMFNQVLKEMDDNVARITAKSGKVYPARSTYDTKTTAQHGNRHDVSHQKKKKKKDRCQLCNRLVKKGAKKNDQKFCRGVKAPIIDKYAKKGNSAFLAKNLLNTGWSAGIENQKPTGDDYKRHPWCDVRNTSSGNLQAHHVITSETVMNNEWKKYRSRFKYDIDETENGVFLPSATDVACQLGVAVHKGPHARGIDYTNQLVLMATNKDIPDTLDSQLRVSNATYIKAIQKELDKIEDFIKTGDFCHDKKQDKEFFTKMRDVSKRGVTHIDNFSWTITGFGKDYRVGASIGCANAKTEGKDKPRTPCVHRINGSSAKHELVNTKGELMTKKGKLEIGK
ncbi:PAAR-like domain-containing protein [Vibrio coralliilyticus]|uniref:PAAR-like domain-containing protein n=1 Tax=Vibrio coralliilyticus TaxID=190893 RepID=UPI0015CB4F4F|nr:PAAR-like domain-containing protein [Vibrio coralliilyticus]